MCEADFQFLVPHVRSFKVTILTQVKKLNRQKKISDSSWIHKRGEDTGQTTPSKTEETGKYRESQLTRAEAQSGNRSGNQCWVGKPEL